MLHPNGKEGFSKKKIQHILKEIFPAENQHFKMGF